MELATEHLATASELQLTAFEGSLCLYTCLWFGIILAQERERERDAESELLVTITSMTAPSSGLSDHITACSQICCRSRILARGCLPDLGNKHVKNTPSSNKSRSSVFPPQGSAMLKSAVMAFLFHVNFLESKLWSQFSGGSCLFCDLLGAIFTKTPLLDLLVSLV